jgi:hypothetical protein
LVTYCTVFVLDLASRRLHTVATVSVVVHQYVLAA